MIDVIAMFTSGNGGSPQRLRIENRGQMEGLIQIPQRCRVRLWYEDTDGVLIYVMLSAAA